MRRRSLSADVLRPGNGDGGTRRPGPAFYLSLAVVAMAYVAVIVLLATSPESLGLGHIDGEVLAAVAIAVALSVGGDVLPVLVQLRDNRYGLTVRWSPAFLGAILFFAGPVPALVTAAVGTVLLGMGLRNSVMHRVISVVILSLTLVMLWGVMALMGWHATVSDPWTPTTVWAPFMAVAAIAIAVLANDVMVAVVLWRLTGGPVRSHLGVIVRKYLAAGGAHWMAMIPVICVMMAHVPVLTVLMVLPLTAVHRALVAEQDSAHAATHDDLTGLANRAAFIERVQKALTAEADRPSLLIMDLNRFKQVNDLLGHPVGDQVLVECARRLQATLPDSAVVARLGGDEFGVLLTGEGDDRVEELAWTVHYELARPWRIGPHDLELGGSVGAAKGTAGSSLKDLYSAADAAMFVAKREGGGPRLHQDLSSSTTTGRTRSRTDQAATTARTDERASASPSTNG